MLICKLCEFSKACEENDYKHKLAKTELPVFGWVCDMVVDVFNEIKSGITYTKDDFNNLPNKVALLLPIFTSEQNKQEQLYMKERLNKANKQQK